MELYTSLTKFSRTHRTRVSTSRELRILSQALCCSFRCYCLALDIIFIDCTICVFTTKPILSQKTGQKALGQDFFICWFTGIFFQI